MDADKMNFWDYATQQCWIDEHDKWYKANPMWSRGKPIHPFAQFDTDLRNNMQSQCEIYLFRTLPHPQGDHWSGYLFQANGENKRPCDMIGTWMGDHLMRVTGYGRTWKQYYRHTTVTYQQVYAIDFNGDHWSGRANREYDLITMKRVK